MVSTYLRCKVIRSSAQRVREVVGILRKAKVGDLYVAIEVEEDVFRFEVAMTDSFAMYVGLPKERLREYKEDANILHTRPETNWLK